MSDQAIKIPDCRFEPAEYRGDMNVLEALAAAFFKTFGITQPTAQTKRRAAWFILALMTVGLIVIVVAAVVLAHIL
ncbi:hypothetical protein GOB94_05620 [Granulicella sp. 5B5]|uniref:hypothetical protein n=1 Tax=Granulicella sp. 5B5 TaxID=1617967 RepID=UPI0015F46DD2|nr:hypothetical protein [Granulicella sp. 5B5]QMV18229.1 hypothetical protein GOB94_05620 [Granulicella sp. 5B5]